MLLSLRRWRPAHLLAAWAAWWCGIIAVTAGDVILAAIRAGTVGGSIQGGLGNDGLGVTVVSKAGETVAMHASFGMLAATLVAPPIALWVLWLLQRPRATAPDARAESLPAGAAAFRDEHAARELDRHER